MERRRETPGLVADQSGAVVLAAVFMAAFMVGCLWFLMGIGDAAVYRERVGAAADSAAYASAVYHARGMNIIAMLNLVMGALVALLIAAKILQILVGIVAVAAAITCAIPLVGTWACPIAAAAVNLWKKLTTVIDQIEAKGGQMLIALSAAQKDVAVVTPWVASSRSTTAAADYSDYVSDGLAVSLSMVPKDKRLGLPVQDEDFNVSCERGGVVARKVIDVVLNGPLAGGFGFFLGGITNAIATSFPASFCKAENGGNPMRFFNPEDLCAKNEKEFNKSQEGKKDEEKEEFDKKKCIDDANEASDDDYAENKKNGIKPEQSGGKDQVDDEALKTMKMVYPPAANGNDYFRIYAFVKGKMGKLTRSDVAVEIPAFGKKKVKPLDQNNEGIAFASAEFYYDQTPGALASDFCWSKPCGMTWTTYKEEAMWNMRWRARLRRYHKVGDVADADILESGIASVGGLTAGYTPAGLANLNGALGSGLAQSLSNNPALAAAVMGGGGGGMPKPKIVH